VEVLWRDSWPVTLSLTEGRMIDFAGFHLDRTQGLFLNDKEVHLSPKSLLLLSYLAERPGRVVSKQEIFQAIWGATTVGDWALTSCIKEIRRVLHDDCREPTFIQTLNRRGYRFIATPWAPS
jgi:DNA-binding winged helix-turn-helix (wHTH) protein